MFVHVARVVSISHSLTKSPGRKKSDDVMSGQVRSGRCSITRLTVKKKRERERERDCILLDRRKGGGEHIESCDRRVKKKWENSGLRC